MFAAIKRLVQEYGRDRISQLSAAFSYFTLFSIGPLLLVVVSLAGFIFGSRAVNGQLATNLSSTFGAQTASTIQQLVAHTHKASHGAIGLVIGVIVLVLGASGLFGQLRGSFDQIFKVKPDPAAGWRNFVWPRLKGILLLGLVSVLVVGSVVASALVAALSKQAEQHFGFSTTGLQVINFAFSTVIIGLLLSFLYHAVPDVRLPWRLVFATGLGIGVLFSIGKTVLALVIGRNAVASAYGAAAALITFLLWVFYFGQIIFLGAEVMKLYGESRGLEFKPKRLTVKEKTVTVTLGQSGAKVVEAFQRGFSKTNKK